MRGVVAATLCLIVAPIFALAIPVIYGIGAARWAVGRLGDLLDPPLPGTAVSRNCGDD